MIAFKVEIDGEEFMLAGAEDWNVLSFHINATRSNAAELPFGNLRTGVGGLSLPDANSVSHHFRWKDKDLSIGSRVVVTVVETDTPQPPVKRYRSDSTVQEDPFTEEEAREMRLQDYLELKKEFGAKHG
jgi:hypothetical protein